MERTRVRQHDTTVMVVGPSGANADRVTAALEQARIRVVRVGSAPVACEKLGSSMPQVVVLVAAPAPDAHADLVDRAAAVGAIICDVDERLEGDAYEELVNELITTAITRKLARDDVDPSSVRPLASEPPATARPSATRKDDDLDEGWE